MNIIMNRVPKYFFNHATIIPQIIVGKKSKLQLKEEQFCPFFDKIGKEKEKRDEDANQNKKSHPAGRAYRANRSGLRYGLDAKRRLSLSAIQK